MRDGELFERLASGDISALDELIGAYYPEILRFCLRHTPTRECAEDAAQETFLNCVRHMDAYAHRGHFRAWLYKIASNACADVLRRARPAEELPDDGRGGAGIRARGAQNRPRARPGKAAGGSARALAAALCARAHAARDCRNTGPSAAHGAVAPSRRAQGAEKAHVKGAGHENG